MGNAIPEALLPIRTVNKDGAAIVFIHGFGGDATATWGSFPQWLLAYPPLADWNVFTLGYETHLRLDVVKLWSADPDLDRVALRLRTEARGGSLAGFQSLCLVAHSMGGLVVQRALLDDARLRQRTSHVFLFGTPSGGLVKASWLRVLKPQLRNMAQGGDFIRNLRADWSKSFETAKGLRLPFEFFVTGGESDEFVPPESSLGPFPEALYGQSRSIVPGNHVQMVKPPTAEHLSVQLLINGLLRHAAPAGPWNAARVAIQSRDFQRAVELLEPHRQELDEAGQVQFALALEGVGRQADAVALLQMHKDSTDAMGTLAGRLKRRWLLSHVEADARGALDLYTQALAIAEAARKPAQVYYQAINVAFMQLVFVDNRAAAKRYAKRALAACKEAETDERQADRKWRFATQGEARLIMGDPGAACGFYRLAAAPEQQTNPREMQSMYQQAVFVSRIVGDEALRRELTAIFRPDV